MTCRRHQSFVKMLFYVVLAVTISISVASGDTSEIRCQEIPAEINTCMGNPKILKASMYKNCKSGSQCDKLTCVFNNAGWLKDNKLNTRKVEDYYDQFTKDYPQWTPAIQRAKINCLGVVLPVQGVYLDCPAYDVTLCTLTNLIQYAQPSQWSSEEKCRYSRQYAAKCPPCPAECFGPFVPYGTCNACLALVPT